MVTISRRYVLTICELIKVKLNDTLTNYMINSINAVTIIVGSVCIHLEIDIIIIIMNTRSSQIVMFRKESSKSPVKVQLEMTSSFIELRKHTLTHIPSE